FNMSKHYFQRIHEQTETRLWINNPNSEEMQKAIAAGAVSCTSNPAYGAKLLQSDPEYMNQVIDEVILEEGDCEKAAPIVYQRIVARAIDVFMPLYKKSNGKMGFVTIQDDPRNDEDVDATIKSVLDNHEKLGKNYMAKIPVIPGGLEALELCVEKNIPICATEVFSIAQAIRMCEIYQAAAKKTGNHPPMYLTHIAGIFDEYLQKVVAREGIDISPEILGQAGCIVARKQYRIMKERGYEAIMLGGGARELKHFTGIVGGDAHVTINWSTAAELIEEDMPLESKIDLEAPTEVVEELLAKLPDFKKAYEEDGLSVDEFAQYGPVQLFRNSFLNGWYTLLAAICKRKNLHAL
ncbi:MAG: hypothetical protein KOO69_06910, partial [Victivallales bacterium]|nr:hypothetical protein [Victivallales bacterium]